MAVERLDIRVAEQGSREAASSFGNLAKAVREVGGAVREMKATLKKMDISKVNRQFAEFAGIAKQAKGHLGTTTQAVTGLDTSFEKMSAELKAFRIEMRNVNQTLSAGVKRMSAVAAPTSAATKSLSGYGKSARLAKNEGIALSRSVFDLRNAFATLGVLATVRKFSQLSDGYQNIQNRLKLVTDGTSDLEATTKRLNTIANKSRQSIESTAESYARLKRATEGQGFSNETLFKTQETINNILRTSGASAEESAGALLQLSQAFSKGKLDGDEFKSVGENLPDVLTALQQSLGVTKGQLRSMSEAGLLTTEVLIEGLGKYSDTAKDAAAKTKDTIGQSLTLLKNRAISAIGEFNKGLPIIKLFTGGIKFLANNLDILIPIIGAVGTAIVAKIIGPLIGSAMAGAISNVKNLKAVLAGTFTNGFKGLAAGLGVFSTGMAIAVPIAMRLGDAIGNALGPEFGREIPKTTNQVDFFKEAIKSTTSEVNNLRARQAELKGLIEVTYKDSTLDTYNRELAQLEERLDEVTGDQDLYTSALARAKEEARIAAKKQQIYNERVQQGAKAFADLKAKLDPVVTKKRLLGTEIETLTIAYTSLNLSLQDYIRLTFKAAEAEAKRQRAVEAGLDNLVEGFRKELEFKKLSKKEQDKINRTQTAVGAVKGSKGVGVFGLLGQTGRVKEIVDILNETAAAELKLGNSTKKATKEADKFGNLQRELFPILAAQKSLKEGILVVDEAIGKESRRGQEVIEALKQSLVNTLNPLEAFKQGIAAEREEMEATTVAAKAALEVRRKFAEVGIGGPLGRFVAGLAGEKAGSAAEALAKDQAQLEVQAQINEILGTRSALQQQIADMKVRELEAALPLAQNAKQEKQLIQEIAKLRGQQVAEINKISDATRILLGETQVEIDHHRAIARIRKELSESPDRQKAIAEENRLYAEQTTFLGKMRAAFRDTFFSKEVIEQGTIDAAISAFDGINSALADQVVALANGTQSWEDFGDAVRDVANQVLSSISKILIQQAIGSALGGIPGFAHGGSMDVPRFAHGGAFTVAGSGGPDKQLVQFLASPGENVHVTNPGQSRLDRKNAASMQQKSEAPINITNVVDPSQFGAALSSPAGQRSVVNTVEMNSDLFRRLTRE